MEIVTIDGSARRDSHTCKALALAEDELRQMKGVALTAADVVCKTIIDALKLLLEPLRLTATLRS